MKTIYFWKPHGVTSKKMHVSILSDPILAAILDFEKQRASNTDVSIYQLLGYLELPILVAKSTF